MIAAGGAAATCRICGSSDLRPHVRLDRNVDVLVCAGCENAMTHPAPVAFYDDHQFFAHVGADSERWRGYSRNIAEFLARHGRTSGRLLDVGSSHGLLLEEAAKIGLDAEGIEPSATAVRLAQARGLRVRRGYLTASSFPPGSFDVIVMSHVVEHIEDPVAFLRIAAALLNDDGCVCLCQTNYRGTLPRWLGRRWPYWVEHEHYHHFSPAGIEPLLERAGLTVAAIELPSLGYHWDPSVRGSAALKRTALSMLTVLTTRLRLGRPHEGDQMYVLARRRPA